MATRRQFAWLFRRRPMVAQDYFSIPIDGLDELIIAYVNSIETEKTTENCLCDWRVHPDDVKKPKGERRVSRANHHPRCPAHTKEGFLAGFMEYARKHG